MTDPRRLREEDPESLEATLLGALRSERPSDAARERVVRSLIAGGTAAGVTLIAAKASAKASSLAWSSGWTIAGVSAGAALTLGTLVITAWPATQAPSPQPPREVVAPAALEPAVHAEPAAPVPSVAHTASEPIPEPPVAPLAPRARKRERTPQAAPARAPGLSDELAALGAVKRALDQGASHVALAQLASYESSFPGGYLQEEALLLRAQALLEADQPALARAVARTLIERAPRGPLAERARELADRAEKRIKPQERGQ